VIRNGRRLTGCSVIAVESVGKHLLVRFDNGWTLRTHLGMPGSWRIEDPGGRWSRNPGAARVVLESENVRAVCYAAPTVQIAPDSVVHSALGHLGPDASGDEFDEAEAVRRLAERPATITVGAAITDQSAIAGVGNVFKSEILFLERIHPAMSLGDLDVEQLTRLARRAHRLLAANRSAGPRTTTGDARPGRRHWVYGRAGLPCRRCRASIAAQRLDGRVSYWCPGCQPEPVSS
jgi:endonuclease-8